MSNEERRLLNLIAKALMFVLAGNIPGGRQDWYLHDQLRDAMLKEE